MEAFKSANCIATYTFVDAPGIHAVEVCSYVSDASASEFFLVSPARLTMCTITTRVKDLEKYSFNPVRLSSLVKSIAS